MSAYIDGMKTALLVLAAAAAILPNHAAAARLQGAQQAMAIDLNACPRPAYPHAALVQRAEGKTTVEVQIGEQGLVTDARVLVSSGRADLDEAAVAAIRRCVFHAVLATNEAPTGWLKTQYVWIPSLAKSAPAQDKAQLAGTRAQAAAGDPVAQNRLGAWYENGTYVKTDLAQAAHWYRLAAQSGNAIAQNNLGVLYNRGAGVPRDPKQAFYWYAKAAGQGHGWAQANLAHYYQFGTAGELDIEKARHWLTKSAEGGLPSAQVQLGLLLMLRAATDEERSAASAWIARAAAQDYPQGVYYLGRSFELGLGNPQDDAQAAAHYRKVLGRSEGRGETALGMLLEAGRAGTASEDELAGLYQKAMQSRYAAAFYQHGLLLERRGDDAMAAAVFRQGAELRDCRAVLKVAQLRPAQETVPAASAFDAELDQRAKMCAAIVAMPPRL